MGHIDFWRARARLSRVKGFNYPGRAATKHNLFQIPILRIAAITIMTVSIVLASTGEAVATVSYGGPSQAPSSASGQVSSGTNTAGSSVSVYHSRKRSSAVISGSEMSVILDNVKANNLDEAPVLSGGEVRFLANMSDASQQLSAVFRSSDGSMIVVDGGVAEDKEHLLDTISGMGGHVDAWLITHPHTDHVGALSEILKEASVDPVTGETVYSYGVDSITIDDYYFTLFDQSWYDDNDLDEAGTARVLRDALSKVPPDRLHSDLPALTNISISENLKFTILNRAMQFSGTYAGNGAGLVYDIDIDGKDFIILGDMSYEGGQSILKTGILRVLSCDYVQMAHHGQAGVGIEFYRSLQPKYCIWPTNSYIFNSSGSGLQTNSTKQIIQSISSVQANYVTLDSDVIIR